MKKIFLHFIRSVGVPGFITWAFMGWALWTARHNGWRGRDITFVAIMTVLVTYVFGASRRTDSDLPYLICTTCGHKNSDPNMDDPAGWSCGYCHRETLVRVGERKPT
jgi:hypothetical protein